jgi:hypothetical protein
MGQNPKNNHIFRKEQITMDLLITGIILLITGNAVLAITTAKPAKVKAKVKAKADTNSQSLPTFVCRKATASKKHWATYSKYGIIIYDSSINPLIK